MLRKPLTPYERVMAKARPDGDCLLFTGAGSGCKSPEGEDHGKVRVRENGCSKTRFAHRIVYIHHHGEPPEGLVVRHKCHRRRCVNIQHLVLGTESENMQDMMEAGRGKNQFRSDDECPF